MVSLICCIEFASEVCCDGSLFPPLYVYNHQLTGNHKKQVRSAIASTYRIGKRPATPQRFDVQLGNLHTHPAGDHCSKVAIANREPTLGPSASSSCVPQTVSCRRKAARGTQNTYTQGSCWYEDTSKEHQEVGDAQGVEPREVNHLEAGRKHGRMWFWQSSREVVWCQP